MIENQDKKPQAITFIEIQATGKTSFYKDHFFNTHLRISLDLLKTRHREKTIFECCIATRTNFVIDNTNPLRTDRERYIKPAKEGGYEVVGYYFSADLKGSIERNRLRNYKEIVPVSGVLGTYKKLDLPSYSEGFDKLYYVTIGSNNQFRIEDWKDEIVMNLTGR